MNNQRINNFRNEMDSAINAYVDAYNAHNKSKTTLKELKADAMSKVSAFNLCTEKETYRAWNEAGDVVKTAIVTGNVPGCKKVTFKVDDNDHMSFKVSDSTMRPRLPMIQAVLGAGVFHDANWFAKMEKLAYLIANRVQRGLCVSVNSYPISEAAKAFNFPAGSNPASIDNMANAIQEVFDGIAFIPSDDDGKNIFRVNIIQDIDGNKTCPAWTYINDCMTEMGTGNGEVFIHNVARLSDIIARDMCRCLNDQDYIVTYGERYTIPDLSEDSEEPEAEK